MLEIYGARLVQTEETIFTVFPHDPDELPQDFESYDEAEAYGDANYGKDNYTIESPTN